MDYYSSLFELLPRIDFDVLSESFAGSGGGGDCVLCHVHHDVVRFDKSMQFINKFTYNISLIKWEYQLWVPMRRCRCWHLGFLSIVGLSELC